MKIPKNDKSYGKGIIFMHIPIQEYMDLYNQGDFYGVDDEYICC